MGTELRIEVPEKVFRTWQRSGLLQKTDEEAFARELKMLAAVKLYELGRLTAGDAAEMVDLPRVGFLLNLGRYEVFAFQSELEDLEAGARSPGTLEAVSSSSPLAHLFRIGEFECLPRLFTKVIVPESVARELDEARARGFRLPRMVDYEWAEIVRPSSSTSGIVDAPEWDGIELGAEGQGRVVLLDDAGCRSWARLVVGAVWGTLQVILEANAQGLTDTMERTLDRLDETAVHLTPSLRRRIIRLADENPD